MSNFWGSPRRTRRIARLARSGSADLHGFERRQIAQELGGKSIYLDLERPADLLQLRDEERFFRDHQDHLVILDEVQTRPELFARLRAFMDNYSMPAVWPPVWT